MTKGALVGALLRVDTLVALHMARTRRFVGAAGVFAVVVVSVIWLLTQFTYSHYCIKLREARALVR